MEVTDSREVGSHQVSKLSSNLRLDTRSKRLGSIEERVDSATKVALDRYQTSDSETEMTRAWVKSAILIRANSMCHGISGVRVDLLQNLIRLLEQDLAPSVPLRGSISASGDLIPLSYIANLLQGSPGVKAVVRSNDGSKILSADTALQKAGITPMQFAPKEFFSFVNGTAFSAGAAAQVVHDAHFDLVLAQVLTAMSIEALHGARESFDPFFAEVRPHPGQKEVAENINAFMWKSRFIKEEIGQSASGLQQDRYSLRTTSQWLGPEVENLLLAHSQVITECNSNTDNPLLAPDGRVMQGGNFQATSITSAMDTVRHMLQMSGRMLFQQLTEMMNPPTNNGLPPNLTADEPSCDFLMKGMDVAAASYTSELAFLSQGINAFPMVAEQGNQSLNSLALISARYAQTALDVFGHLTSTMLVALCQALDLRAIQRNFHALFIEVFKLRTREWAQKWLIDDPKRSRDCQTELWSEFLTKFRDSANLDLTIRFKSIMDSLYEPARKIGRAHGCHVKSEFCQDLDQWTLGLAASAQTLYQTAVDEHTASRTMPYLGVASRKLYTFVREIQQVPFLRRQRDTKLARDSSFVGAGKGDSLGSYISRIYSAQNRGLLLPIVVECLKEARAQTEGPGCKAKL